MRTVVLSILVFFFGAFGMQAAAQQCERLPSPFPSRAELDLRPCDRFAAKSAIDPGVFLPFAERRFSEPSFRDRIDESLVSFPLGSNATLVMRSGSYYPVEGVKIRHEGIYTVIAADDQTSALFGAWLTKNRQDFRPRSEKVLTVGFRAAWNF